MMRYFSVGLLLLSLTVQGEEIPHVIIQTNLGIIEAELIPEKAPETVENFLTYVKAGFYENTIFHRVINNFIVQGGGYTMDYQKKPTSPSIPNEAANGLKNLRGTIAMARSNDPHSATSQFFFNVKDNKFLDYQSSTPAGWGYCVFGKVIDGMEVIEKISQVPTDAAGPFRRDVPQTQVIIEAMKVEYISIPQSENNSSESPVKEKSKKAPAAVTEKSETPVKETRKPDKTKIPPAVTEEEKLSSANQEEAELLKEAAQTAETPAETISKKESTVSSQTETHPEKSSPQTEMEKTMLAVPKTPSQTETEKPLLGLPPKKNEIATAKPLPKKTATPPDSPTLPDRPEPPIN